MGYIVKTRLRDQASGISLCDTTDLEFDLGVRGARRDAKKRQKMGGRVTFVPGLRGERQEVCNRSIKANLSPFLFSNSD